MSTDKDVVADDTKLDPKDTSLDSGAQTDDDLDVLLSEIDKDFVKDTEADPESKEDTELSNKVDHLLKKDEDAAIAGAVTSVQNDLRDLDVSAPDDAIEGMLNQMAGKDTRFKKAFQNRDESPEDWGRVLGAASKTIAKKFGDQVDKNLTDDRAAVENAIKGSSTTNEEDTSKNYKGMSDSDFEKEKLKY